MNPNFFKKIIIRLNNINFPFYIRNNVFYQQGSGEAAISAVFIKVIPIIEYNSFLSTDRIALKLAYQTAQMIAGNNFWNTADTSVIDSMIYDRNDDLGVSTLLPRTLSQKTRIFLQVCRSASNSDLRDF